MNSNTSCSLALQDWYSESLFLQTPPMAVELEGGLKQAMVAWKWMFSKDKEQEDGDV